MIDIELFLAVAFLILAYIFIVCPCIPHLFANLHLTYWEAVLRGLAITGLFITASLIFFATWWAMGIITERF